MEYAKGDRVRIVGGMYKCFKTGTYKGKYGKKMATVAIDGDKERNLWMSSIAPAAEDVDVDGGDVLISGHNYNGLLQEIDTLTVAVERLKLKAKMLDNK